MPAKNSEEEKISDAKLYELVLSTKWHEAVRRDEINKYYTSLFTSMIALASLIEKFTEGRGGNEELNNLSLRAALIALSLVAISISISWILILKRISNYMDSFDKVLTKLEEASQKNFIIYVNRDLSKIHSPDRVTKQSMLVPIMFLIVFIAGLLYYINYFVKFSF